MHRWGRVALSMAAACIVGGSTSQAIGQSRAGSTSIVHPVGRTSRVPGGRLPGPASQVVVDGNGNILVLQRGLRRLLLVDSNGTVLDSTTVRRGGTEIGMTVPSAIGAFKDSFIAVDVAEGVVKVLSVASDKRRLTKRGEWRIPMTVWSACTLLDRVVVSGLHDGKMIHVYDRDGRHLSSFGDPFGGSEALLQDAFGRTVVACGGADSGIVVASRLLPELRAYTLSGRLRWTAQLQPFAATTVQLVGGGRRLFAAPPGGASFVTGATIYRDMVVIESGLSNAAHRGGDEDEDLGERHADVFALASGAKLDVPWRQPAIFALSPSGSGIGLSSDRSALVSFQVPKPVIRAAGPTR